MHNYALLNGADTASARCTMCPRACGAPRADGAFGYCNSGVLPEVASVCVHRGEEPVFGPEGMCNVFFYHCTMQCVYCQNSQISVNSGEAGHTDAETLAESIRTRIGPDRPCVGFVSPSHFVPQMRETIAIVKRSAPWAVAVMNTGAYDRRETISSLEDEMDVYLPDLKYMDEALARKYSRTPGYPGIALAALREMYRQKGSNLALDDAGIIRSGLVIRHLILPGHVENSIACLRAIAEELSASVHVSLMAQYHPTDAVRAHPVLGRTITRDEYETVLEEFYRLGFYRGWVQEMESSGSYLPDFGRGDVFG
ncbi:MAG: radical SAM protein [Spirochaetes bacterium]|nr:MAG: radical SAM protein [Spirochaetota bacterium]